MKFEDLKGMTLARVDVAADKESITLGTTDGRIFRQHHRQDCCESVSVEDIAGDLSDIIGEPLLLAEESSREAEPGEVGESGTWTFYKLATIKGSVTIRWLGESNGYYSEDVDVSEIGAE
jgi:hypothetical protein